MNYPYKKIQQNPDENSQSTSNKRESIHLCSEDHDDMLKVLETVIPDCPSKLAEILLSQQKHLQHLKQGRRWSKNIIRICITM